MRPARTGNVVTLAAVSAIGYLGFLAGPPLIGGLAEVTSLHLATAPEVASVTGDYFIARRPRRPSRAAREPARAEWLWAESERLLAPWL